MTSRQKLVKLFYTLGGQIEREQVNLACEHLKNKGVIILPTDTLYGLAARVNDSEAIERIYNIKGRLRDKPLAVCVSHVSQVADIADTSKLKENLLRCLLPGPVTVVLNRSTSLNKNLNPGVETIGVRVTQHNFVAAITHEAGPIALTSANRSGEQDPIAPQHFEHLIDEVDCAFDNGLLRKYVEDGDLSILEHLGSTVVDLSIPNKFRIIREGCASNRTVNMLLRFGYRPDNK